MPALYLIRHGQASFDAEDYDQLSLLGEKQGKHLGQTFAVNGLQAQHVICGGMKRHRQTAESCISGMGVDVTSLSWQIDPDWNEYDHLDLLQAYTALPGVGEQMVADMAGDKPRAGFQSHFAKAMQRWVSGQYDSDYSESWAQFSARIRRAVEAAASSTKGNVFVFTSGGAISAVCGQVLGLTPSSTAELSWQLANGAYSKILCGQSGMKLLSINEHSHFDGHHRELLSYR
ncbi:histidine phosphatase family protein [Zhongshania sp.]|uniref:histidine phosphatase family protein n=1 Tax=Zhongshania sp. TaxID=1971902 RepID=UPI003568E2E3